MFYLGIFGMEFVKVIVTFEISNLEFLKMQCFGNAKKRTSNLELKMPHFRFH